MNSSKENTEAAQIEYRELRELVSVLGTGPAQRAADNYLLAGYVRVVQDKSGYRS